MDLYSFLIKIILAKRKVNCRFFAKNLRTFTYAGFDIYSITVLIS